MRRALLTIPLVLCVPGCAGWQEHSLKALDASTCVLADEALSVAFKAPDVAKKYLKDLGRRLKEKDPAAVDEAAALTKKLLECVPE